MLRWLRGLQMEESERSQAAAGEGDARAIKTAFELGLIDRLLESRSGSVEALGRALGVDAAGLRLLLDLLGANQVVEERGGDVRLAKRFLDALRYRDLLETKLDFA